MERESEQVYASERYIDYPAPGKGFLAFLFIGTLVPVGLFGYRYLAGNQTHDLQFFLGSIIVFGAMFAFFLYSAYHTSYTVGMGKIVARSGFFSSTIELSDIESIKYVKFARQALGSSWRLGGKCCGRCNRFMNCVALTTSWGQIFLSPSDPEKFISVIRKLHPLIAL